MRIKRDFERQEDTRSGRLIIIASEGVDSEVIYFKKIKERYSASNIDVRVIEREEGFEGHSSPSHVVEMMEEYLKDVQLQDEDEAWLVCDKDRWPQTQKDTATRYCAGRCNVNLCVSNPCFELWLLLHLEDIQMIDDETQKLLVANHGDWLKKRLCRPGFQYHDNDYHPEILFPKETTAIQRAIELDIKPEEPWPENVCTRVYRIIQSIQQA